MRSMVEGRTSYRLFPLIANLDQSRHYRLNVPQYVPRRYPRCHKPTIAKPSGPPLIARYRIRIVMCLTVNLDSQTNCRTIKIQHERSSGMLAAKLVTTWTFAQFAPQQSFGQRHLTTQSSGELYGPT